MNNHIEGAEISAFLDGALAAGDRARVEAHLPSCSSCRGELEALRHMKLVLSSAPRKTMPASLALAMESRHVESTSAWKILVRPAFWVPAGALAAVALTVSLWISKTGAADELPLEPLLAAHERYSAESLVPQDNLIASNYSDQLNSFYEDGPDVELQ